MDESRHCVPFQKAERTRGAELLSVPQGRGLFFPFFLLVMFLSVIVGSGIAAAAAQAAISAQSQVDMNDNMVDSSISSTKKTYEARTEFAMSDKASAMEKQIVRVSKDEDGSQEGLKQCWLR